MDLEDAPQEDPDAGLSVGTVHAAFILSAAVAVALTFGKDLIKGKLSTNSDVGGQTPQFKAFQRTYLTVYLLMMAGDWLQGPYMYALYDAYGFKHEEIAALFVAGFFSARESIVFRRGGSYLLGVASMACRGTSSASTSSGARPRALATSVASALSLGVGAHAVRGSGLRGGGHRRATVEAAPNQSTSAARRPPRGGRQQLNECAKAVRAAVRGGARRGGRGGRSTHK